MAKIKDKKKDKKKLKSLHSALKSLLKEEKKNKTGYVRSQTVKGKDKSKKVQSEEEDEEVQYKNGRAYIHSKENQLIPKLTDDEVMEKHKLADEKMKQVWTNIIEKYENVEDQGDVVNLHTGEIVTDNGHVRNLNAKEIESKTRYDSVVKDLLYNEGRDGENHEEKVEHYNQYSIWDEEDDDEDSASFTDQSSS
ncbi:Protein SCM3 [Nakaseomyces bracarensis]|uniref:Protein SCM3 n=1 Tax=Nakaseomyces bracarensis TaxID=273131 RepID=A0ABR4NW49_9SACH